ncbi:hypothetical protein ABZU75_38200 [Streptosporangium sp. NPDC005286]|uniref:hypothetical protein n=1 Tax=Streptosporangium sp. NPDC005286 TaxID=3154463 RepID=UPI0033A15913
MFASPAARWPARRPSNRSGGAVVVRCAAGQVDLVTYFGAAGIGIIVGREQVRREIDDPLSHLVISRGAINPPRSFTLFSL